jgi:hypothetical protein
MKWSGDSAVDVAIVNWIKGNIPGKKRLYIQEGQNTAEGWRFKEFEKIGPALSFDLDVTTAQPLQANAAIGGCFQGQTQGHEGFLLGLKQAQAEITSDPRNAEVLFPLLIASELIGRKDSLPTRYVIDFHPREQLAAQIYRLLFERIKRTVLPDRQRAAAEERKRNEEAVKANSHAEVNHHHQNFLNRWWLLSYPREDMISAITPLSRYIACGRVTLRPIFEFIGKGIRPNDALMVFPFEDNYSFGILQSSLHWTWFINRCSTLTGRYRYTSNTVFDTFPWPQAPSLSNIKSVAIAARDLWKLRRELMRNYDLSLRELYRSLERPGRHPLKDAQEALDVAVRQAYGMSNRQNSLESLLTLNEEVSAKEISGAPVTGPGLPAFVRNPKVYVTDERIKMPTTWEQS